MTIFLVKIFLHTKKRAEHLIRILFIVFRSPRDVVEHRHEDNPSCEILWFPLNFDSNSWTLLQSCNVVNPKKIFHSNSIGSPSILSRVLYPGELLNHVNLSSHA